MSKLLSIDRHDVQHAWTIYLFIYVFIYFIYIEVYMLINV